MLYVSETDDNEKEEGEVTDNQDYDGNEEEDGFGKDSEQEKGNEREKEMAKLDTFGVNRK